MDTRPLVLALVAATASAADADVAEWLWTVSDTGNGDGVIESGESVLLTLGVSFNPDATGFAGADLYSIGGDGHWAAGEVETRENLLDGLGLGPGTLDESTNTISEIWNFQLSPFFNVNFNSHNPIMLYSIQWRPDRYADYDVALQAEAPDAWIYTDEWGNNTLYEGVGGLGSFTVVPGPATFGAGVAIFGLSVRRRR